MGMLLLPTLLSRAHGGYRAKTLDYLFDGIKFAFSSNFSSSQLEILEFGNQEIHDLHTSETVAFLSRYGYDVGNDANVSMKPFFSHLGFKYTSIDRNGLDGALAIDVRQDLTVSIQKKFDIITNVGFSEHINEFDVEDSAIFNQYLFFKSIHDLGKVGALYFHDLPKLGSWFQHGMCNYETSFFRALAESNGYELILLMDSYHLARIIFGEMKQLSVTSIYRKVAERPFISFETFKGLPGIRSVYSEYHSIMFRVASPSGEQTVHVSPNLTENVNGIVAVANQVCGLSSGVGDAETSQDKSDDSATSPQWCVDMAVKALQKRWVQIRRTAGDSTQEEL